MALRKFPYGYEMVSGRIAVCESEAEVIRRLFRERAEGVSNYAAAKRLYDTNTDYFDGSVKKASCKISRILYDRRYTGADGYPPIVDGALFGRVQALKGKPCAARRSAPPAEERPKPDMYVYLPSAQVMQMEARLRQAMQDGTDAEQIRTLLLGLAAAKYVCIQ